MRYDDNCVLTTTFHFEVVSMIIKGLLVNRNLYRTPVLEIRVELSESDVLEQAG